MQPPVGPAITTSDSLSRPPLSGSVALPLDTEDLLDIQTFDTPDLSAKLRVDENGRIALPSAVR